MTNQPQSFKEVTVQAAQSLTPDALDKMRSVALAGAGVCTALVLFILQAEDLRLVGLSALVLACTGMPLLLASGFMVESYMVHGEASYRTISRPIAFALMSVVFLVGSACLVASFFFLIREFFPLLAWYFLAVSGLSFVVTMWHNADTKPST